MSAIQSAQTPKAAESLKPTEDDVEKGIDEARAGLKAVNAELVLSRADHVRIANLESRGSRRPPATSTPPAGPGR